MEWGERGVIPPPKRAVIIDLSVNVFNIFIATHGGLVAVQLPLLLQYGIPEELVISIICVIA